MLSAGTARCRRSAAHASLQRTPSPRSQSSCAPSRASRHFPRRLSQAGPTSGCLGIALTSRRAARTKTAARTRRREPSWAARLECEAPAAASQQARPTKSVNHRLRQGRESCSDARRRPRRTRAPADAAGAVAQENRSAGALADRPRPADDSPIASRPPGSTPKIWRVARLKRLDATVRSIGRSTPRERPLDLPRPTSLGARAPPLRRRRLDDQPGARALALAWAMVTRATIAPVALQEPLLRQGRSMPLRALAYFRRRQPHPPATSEPARRAHATCRAATALLLHPRRSAHPRCSPPAPAVAALTSPAALAAAPRVPHRPRVVQRPAYRARGPPCPRASPATPAAAAQVAATPASPAALAVPPHVLQSGRTSRRGAAPRAVAAVTTTCWSAPESTLMAAYVQSSLSPLVRRLYSTGLSSRAVLPSREAKTVVVPTTSTCRASEHDWCAWINGGRAKDGVSATQCAERLSRP